MSLSLRGVLTFSSIVVAASALAACGGSAGSSNNQVAQLDPGTQAAPNTTTTPSTTSSGSFQDTLLKFAQCMRSNGVNVPDPTFDANGRPQFQQGSGQQLNRNDPAFRAAFDKCRTVLQSALPQFSQSDRQAFQNAALKYAQCMRQHGINIPDPNFNSGGGGFGFGGGGAGGGGGGGGGPFGNINRNDPKFQAANEACRSAFQNLPRRGGFFGGGPPSGTTTNNA